MWTSVIDLLAGVAHTFWHNKARSLLSLLGMIIGAGSMVLLAGLLAGAQEGMVMTHQFLQEADVIEVEEGPVPPQKAGRTQRPLDQGDGDLMAGHELLGGVDPEEELFAFKKMRAGTEKMEGLLLGASERAAEMYRVQVERGRFLDARDVESRARVCVVGQEIWQKLLGAPEKLDGVSLKVAGVQWAVIGVLKHKPVLIGKGGPWTWDRRVVVPATTFQVAVRHSRKVDSIYLRVLPGMPGQDLWGQREAEVRAIKQMVLRRHYGVENFKVDADKGDKQQEEMIIMIINVLMLCTAGLSLFAGGINIMNIMLVTVTERTREIGVRRALGATRGDILRQFLLESAIVSGLGGILGVLGGVVMVFLASKGLSAWLGSWPAHYKVWAMGLGLGSSALTGVVFGIYPAWKAARLDPVEALRYE
jgi:putative ABC transport system permease protein